MLALHLLARVAGAAFRKLPPISEGPFKRGYCTIAETTSKGSRTTEGFTLPIARIERIVSGSIVSAAASTADGFYACHESGSNVDPVRLSSLDEVAEFLR